MPSSNKEGFLFSRSKSLIAAYLATDYVIRHRKGEIRLRISEKNPAADCLLHRFKARSAVFVTAWNPLSQSRSPQWNSMAHYKLLIWLRQSRIRFLEGEGRSRSGEWPAEQSVLAFGLNQRRAAQLGRRFRQNAVVMLERGRAPRLLCLQ